MRANFMTAVYKNGQPLLSKEQFNREASYRMGLAIARNMLSNELITKGEFVRIGRFLAKKFSPVWGGLYHKIS